MRQLHRLSLVILLLLSSVCFAQQDYIGRFNVFGGFSYFNAGKLDLVERGFNGQFGYNWKPWLALGFDFSTFTGHSTIFPDELNPNIQARLVPLLATLPPGTTISLPFDASTQTYAAGPQFNIRHWKRVTLFVRPGLGALHESVTTKPNDPLTTVLVNSLIGPSGKTSDTVVFYGFGGGFDLNFTNHVALRAAADFAHFDVFSSLLNGPRNAVRVSVGPAIQFGGNAAK